MVATPDRPTRPSYDAVTSVGALFHQAVDRFGERVCMRQKSATTGEWVSYHWRDVARMVDQTAAALIAEGIERGDRVAVLSNSRLEWAVADMAIQSAGAVTVPVYQSNLPDEVQYILEHAGAVAVFVEDGEQQSKVQQVHDALPDLRRVVQFTGKVRSDDDLVFSLDRFRDVGREALERDGALLETRLGEIERDDMATIVYTSGTTGRPKGAVMTHDALLFEIESVSTALSVDHTDETVLFLPLAHIFARIGLLAQLHSGFIISFAESIPALMTNMAEVRPTFVFSVPRIYEKVHAQITARVAKSMRLSRQMFAFATMVGRWVSKARQRGIYRPWLLPHLALLEEMANMLVLRKLARLFGGKLRFFISGGAPLSREIAEFMHSIGILVLEGWGLTETAAAATLNTTTHYRFGTVGKVLPGVEVKVAEDGELLIRGRNILREYYRRPEATAEALSDGWFHSGDIGEIDDDGFVRITDRKKDLIVTSGGKNIAPQNIENQIKQQPFISQAVVYGDQRNYLVGLVTLDEEEVRKYAEEREIEFETFAELTRHPRVVRRVDRQMAEVNKKLPSWETIKYWAILERDFEVGEELTPSLKVKRKVVTARYRELIDGLYR